MRAAGATRRCVPPRRLRGGTPTVEIVVRCLVIRCAADWTIVVAVLFKQLTFCFHNVLFANFVCLFQVREPPLWNGLGGEEDTLNSCKRLVPRRPRRDEKKYHKFEGQLLRFSACTTCVK